MAQKNNIRSIRFSDEMAALIDQQIGDTFTQKFENLVTRCVWELPQKEEELRRVRELIDRKRQQLSELNRTIIQLDQLKRYIDQAQEHIEHVERKAKAIAESIQKP